MRSARRRDENADTRWVLCVYYMQPRSAKITSSNEQNRLQAKIIKKFPSFYRTGWCSTSPTQICHLFLSWAKLIQSQHSHRIPLRSILGLVSLSCPRPPRCLFLSDLATKILLQASHPLYLRFVQIVCILVKLKLYFNFKDCKIHS